MDIPTLTLINSLCSAFMAIMMGVVYKAMPDEPSLRDWALAGLLLFINSAWGLVPGAAQSGKLTLGAICACLYMGHAAVISGVRHHLHLPSSSKKVLLIGLGGLLLWLGCSAFGAPNQVLLTLAYAYLILIDLGGAHSFLRHPTARVGSPLFLLGVLHVAYAATVAVRAAIIMMSPERRRYLMNAVEMHKVGELSMFVYILLSSAFCVALVLLRQAHTLRSTAITDPMTGWLNRRSMEAGLTAELSRARRTGTGFHLITFDIDHFKRINDQHGHGVGDQVICQVTRLAEQELRGYDQKFRTGGEEFVVCIPADSAEIAMQVAERLCHRIGSEPLQTTSGAIAATVSIGHAAALDGDCWQTVLKRADEALYQAKQSGRNRVLTQRL